MTHAIRIARTGGPEVLAWQEWPVGEPGPGQVHIRHTAIALNYIDVYHRSGVYPFPLPGTPGLAAAGRVVAVGEGVSGLRVGDRVAYAGGPPGAYAEERLIPAERVIVLSPELDDEIVASVLFSGLTTQFLVRRVYRVAAGDCILVHAAAGNVGLLICQWAKHLGATVIGTAGSDAKAEVCLRHGCDHAIVYSREDFVAEVSRLTGGAKVNVVYDSVGKDTVLRSLDCLKPMGLLVSLGLASGEAPPLDLGMLMSKGSLYVTRPSFAHYMGPVAAYWEATKELLALLETGVLRVVSSQRFALKDAAIAHQAMEQRKTTGASLLIP